MKKSRVKNLLFLVILLCFVYLLACSRRTEGCVIGTWEAEHDGEVLTIVFNANGTFETNVSEKQDKSFYKVKNAKILDENGKKIRVRKISYSQKRNTCGSRDSRYGRKENKTGQFYYKGGDEIVFQDGRTYRRKE